MNEGRAILLLMLFWSAASLASTLLPYLPLLSESHVDEYRAWINGTLLKEEYVYHVRKGFNALFRTFEKGGIRPVSVECPEGFHAYMNWDGEFWAESSSQEILQMGPEAREVGCYRKNAEPGKYLVRYEFQIPEGEFWIATSHIPYFKVSINSSHAYPREGTSWADEAIVLADPGKDPLLISKIALLLTLLSGPFLYGFYLLHGKDRAEVPEFLNFAPAKRKAWEVAWIFGPRPGEVDAKGVAAVLLDLKRRGKAEIRKEGNDIRIRITDWEGLDEVERKVAEMADSRRLKEIAKGAEAKLKELSRLVSEHLKGMLAPSYLHHLVLVAGIIMFAISRNASFMGHPLSGQGLAVWRSLLLLAVGAFASFLPRDVFGKWKGIFAKEKAEWEAFRRFLSDLAMIRKYEPDDLAVWKEWLVYGTALGVADRVMEAMKGIKGLEEDVEISRPFLAFSFQSSGFSSTSFTGIGSGGAGVR